MEKAHTGKTTNRLISEKSPYLRQHAENPVDWYPWSDEALKKAKSEDKPLLISIGYSSCHWCHVMERESFEDPETARIMNENFVTIKVDREERPDLDSLYMKAVQAITGQGGWPLNVFTTPEGVPFYGGTYFPPGEGFGMPSFKKVLLAVSESYKNNRARISSATDEIKRALSPRPASEPVALEPEISGNALEAAKMFFDPVYGGFGTVTKFPHAMFLKFLLKYHKRTGNPEALSIVKKTLSSMAAGGIYDHLGGGFHRYSVDEMWEIPHFEKMLYDNALLIELYSLAYGVSGVEFYKDIATETIDYLMRDMLDASGGFYCAEDADVEGKEGEYYLWGVEEIKEVLNDEDAKRFMRYFCVTDEGNLEGKNTLRISPMMKDPDERVPDDMKEMEKALFKARLKRKRPDTDRKIITAWNGLIITALTEAGRAFNRADYLDTAKRCALFLLESSEDEKGRLYRYCLDGKADVHGTLEDYALLGTGLLSIYGATGKESWLREAADLAGPMTALFYDKKENLFYDTGADLGKFFVRERDLFDNDVPSGNSAAADLLLKLSRLTEVKRYAELSEEILKSIEGIKDDPLTYGNFLCVLEDLLSEEEIVRKTPDA